MKYLIIALLFAIVASLGTGLFHLTRQNDDPRKLLRSLQVRVALSIVLVFLLVAAWFLGWIPEPTAA